eukprot:s379_g30.t1
MPSTTEEYRRVMKTETFAWLAMASRYKAKCWLHGLTADPFVKFTEYVLGDRVYGVQIPSLSGDSAQQQKIRPDWSIILAYEFKLRKEAMKKVMSEHTLAESMLAVIRDPDLKEAFFTTPMALRAAMPESQPNKYVRNNKGNFNSKSFATFSKGGWCGFDKPAVQVLPASLHLEEVSNGKTLKVMYLFAGHQRHSDVGSFLRKAAKSQSFELVMEFDIERSPDHDLTDNALWEKMYTFSRKAVGSLLCHLLAILLAEHVSDFNNTRVQNH